MTAVVHSPGSLATLLSQELGGLALDIKVVRGEVTVTVDQPNYFKAMCLLRDSASLKFEQLVDLCGIDYLEYQGQQEYPHRFATVVHLLSVSLNHRVRIRVFSKNDDFPRIDSVVALWSSASWYEREAFDLYGIVFDGHDDLRRILTDYGFIGHPFRKDFPISGHVEMRYDADRQRVVYEPVTIEPRENTPRIVREDNYGGLH